MVDQIGTHFKTFNFIKLDEDDVLGGKSGALQASTTAVRNFQTDLILYTCMTDTKIKTTASSIVEGQLKDAEQRTEIKHLTAALVDAARAKVKSESSAA